MWRSRTKRKAGESLAFAGVVIGPAIDWPALFGLLQAVSAMQMRTAIVDCNLIELSMVSNT